MALSVEASDVECARSGGEPLERLIAAIWPEAFRVALTILRDRGLAEDTAQEACAAIARSLPLIKSINAFKTWAYKVIVSHALTAARRRRLVLSLDAATEREIAFDPSDALDLFAALASLTPKHRAAILLHYYAGLRSGEIAAAIGVPASTIRFHLMLARKNLRKALSAPISTTAHCAGVIPNVH
jgi:RNA polymerase sigma-70 factor (ECF subfamily)